MSYEELWSFSLTILNSEDSLQLKWGDILLIEQLQKVIKYISKIHNKNIRKNLIALQSFEFRNFLHKPKQDRFRMSEHVKSVISAQRKFLKTK